MTPITGTTGPLTFDAECKQLLQDEERRKGNAQVRTFGVQLNGQSGRVVAGEFNEAQTDLNPGAEDVTDNAVLAVSEYVLRVFDGALEVDYDDGIIYQIQVVKLGPTRADGTRVGLHPGGWVREHEPDPQN